MNKLILSTNESNIGIEKSIVEFTDNCINDEIENKPNLSVICEESNVEISDFSNLRNLPKPANICDTISKNNVKVFKMILDKK